jgi:hypothetical protein
MALEARELDPHEPYNETKYPQLATGVWLLKSSIIGKNCLAQRREQFNISIGSLTCLDQRFYNVTTWKTQWWGSPNHTEPNAHPLSNFSHLCQAWTKSMQTLSGEPYVDCTGYVGKQPALYFP